ncbi:MAG: tryptophan synthase subunit alpha [Candidatus Desulforudis sp.]|nr:tryptophan synthase subunit alpha [Desulforudis sp.]
MSDNRITRVFAELNARGEKALIPFVTAGYPDLETTAELVLGMARAGADVIELGVPFSDPLADGPTIQRASQAALSGGINLRQIVALVARLREQTAVPLVLMSYFNPILSYGLEAFVSEASRAGVDGLIVPDLPVEEADPLLELGDARGLALIPLVAPTSTPERITRIAAKARGFVYCVSLTGVTGRHGGFSKKLAEVIGNVRAQTGLPLAIGFGIAEPGQVRELAPYADALIVGSAIVNRISAAGENGAVKAVQNLVTELKQALVKK